MLNSIWANYSDLPSFPPLKQDLKTDVLIVGGGLAGILIAWQLDQAGIDYALIEADSICCGVSRNTTAKITSQHGLIYHRLLREFDADTVRAYWEINQAALAEYRDLAASVDCDFETKDHYLYSVDRTGKLEAELAALNRLGIPAEFERGVSLPFYVAGAIRFSDQAQFHPLKFVSGIAKELRVFEHTPAREFIGNTVRTDHGKITASKIIIATHFPIINKHGSYFMKMYQQRSYVLAVENAADVDGMYLEAEENGISLRNHGNLLLLGGGGHRTGKQGEGWSELEQLTQRYYPYSREVCRWATQDCMSLDGMPYIGQYSKRTPDLFVATGFNKWGMTSSMAAAMILKDLVQGKDHPGAAIFSPSRSMLRPQLFGNLLESTVNLLKLTKPRCPHLGCALKWNEREHSWDCPCHGSRFAADGKLLDNPATDDMKNSRSS